MIFGNIRQLEEYSFLGEQLQKCFRYAGEHDLLGYEKGSHEIEGSDLFVNVVEYTTTERENRFWEAHKEYLDVHLMLQGTERIDLNFIANMEAKEYVSEEDFLPLEGEENSSVVMRPGDFLICFPNDGHRTAVAVGQPETIRKVIFKVKI